MSMSVKLAMEAVNKSAITQLDRLSAHVIQAILWLVLAFNALVSLLADIATCISWMIFQLLKIITFQM